MTEKLDPTITDVDLECYYYEDNNNSHNPNNNDSPRSAYYDSISDMDDDENNVTRSVYMNMNESFVTASATPQDNTSCSLFNHDSCILEEDDEDEVKVAVENENPFHQSNSKGVLLSQVVDEDHNVEVEEEDSPSSMIQMDMVTLDQNKLVMDRLQIHDDDNDQCSNDFQDTLDFLSSPQHQFEMSNDDSHTKEESEVILVAALRKELEESRRQSSKLEEKLRQSESDVLTKLTENTIEVTSTVTGKVTLAMSDRINAAEKLAKERGLVIERLKKETNEELEEVILSLDRVETEYEDKLRDVLSQLDEKEVAYAALSANFSEMRSSMQQNETKMFQMDMELQSYQVKISTMQLEAEKSKKSFSKMLEDEKRLREVEVENAKSSMRFAAELQFGMFHLSKFYKFELYLNFLFIVSR